MLTCRGSRGCAPTAAPGYARPGRTWAAGPRPHPQISPRAPGREDEPATAGFNSRGGSSPERAASKAGRPVALTRPRHKGVARHPARGATSALANIRAPRSGMQGCRRPRTDLPGDGGLAGAVEGGEEGALALDAVLGLLVVQRADEADGPVVVGAHLPAPPAP